MSETKAAVPPSTQTSSTLAPAKPTVSGEPVVRESPGAAPPATAEVEPCPLDDVRRAFIQLWGAMGSFWGIPPTTAQVHSFLLSQAEGKDADEIMEGLELSRGAVSMACRELRDWGLIHAEKQPGARRVTFRPATDLERVIRNIVQIRKRREWDPVLDNLREWIPRLDTEDGAEVTIFRQRLVALEGLLASADSLIEGFLRGGLVGRLGLKLLVRAAAKETERSAGEQVGDQGGEQTIALIDDSDHAEEEK